MAAAGAVVVVALLALMAGFGSSSAPLLWCAAALAAVALALWVASTRTSHEDAGVPSGPAIGLRVRTPH